MVLFLSMENYTVDPKQIGSGAYGDVYKVRSKANRHDVFALKVFRSSYLVSSSNETTPQQLLDTTIRELSCLTALRGHPHIVWLHRVMHYKGEIAALMSYYPYTLNNIFEQRFFSPLSVTARISRQIAKALAHIHALNWIHRDLTPSNVMLTEDLTVKVGDMGLSRNTADWMSGGPVTVPYRAPELFSCVDMKTTYTNAIDMWSLGVLIVELVEHKNYLFIDRKVGRVTYSTFDILKQVFAPDEYKKTTECNAIFSADCMLRHVLQEKRVKEVVFKLLTICPSNRLTALEFLECKDWRLLSHRVVSDDIRVILSGLVVKK